MTHDNMRIRSGIMLDRLTKTSIRFFENVRKSLIILMNVLNGFSNGKNMQAPIMFMVRWTSQTTMAAGSPVARAAIITSKTVPMLAPSIYGKR